MPCPSTHLLNHPTRRVPLALFVLALLPMAGALVSQYGFGLHPCHLCILQRYPYIAVMVLAGIALLMRCPHFLKMAVALAALAFFTDAAVALLHTGVERHWWQDQSWWPTVENWLGLADCSGQGAATSIEELRKMLLNAPKARCDQPQFVFLGLSMASWNGLYAFMAGMFSLKLMCGLCCKESCKEKEDSCDA